MTSKPGLRTPFRLLRRHHDLRLLLGAGLVSMTGDWLLGVGLTYAVYARTGSTLASAATLLCAFVPQVLAGLVAGVLVDRWDRRRTMIGANLLLAVGLLPLVVLDTTDLLWVVYAVLVWESLVEVFFAPAEQALLPVLVGDPLPPPYEPTDGPLGPPEEPQEPEEGDLVIANGLNAQNQQLSRLLGGALGGVAAAWGGVPAVALADAATFLVATALLLRIRGGRRRDSAVGRPVTEPDATEVVRGRLAALGAEWGEGWRASWHRPVVRVLLVFSLVTAVGEGIMGTLFAPYVRDVLGGSAAALGLITSAQAVGGIVGGLLVAVAGPRLRPARMLGVGSVLFGLVDLAIFLYPLVLVRTWPAVLGMALVGLPAAFLVAGMMTLFQTHTLDAQRGRVFGLVFAVRAVAQVAGTTAAGFLGESLGIVPVLAVQGLGYVVAGLMVLVLLREDASEAAADSQPVGSPL